MKVKVIFSRKKTLELRILKLKPGFTLVETLIAGVIAIILGAAIVMVLNRGDMTFQQEITSVGLQQQVRSAVDGMAREIRQGRNIVITGPVGNNTINFDIVGSTNSITYLLNSGQIIRQHLGTADKVLANNIDNITFTQPTTNTVFIDVGAQKTDRRGRELSFSLVEKVRLRNE